MDKESFFISLFDSKFIGDDGAIIDELIYSSDMFFENVHFKREWMSLYQIARKSMLVNISDAVAMNAKALYAILDIQIPSTIENAQLVELAKGFNDISKEFDIEIVGGDTISGDRLNISVTIISRSSNPLTRYGVKSGQLLAFTGELGESLKHLNMLLKYENIPDDSKFYEPKLRVDFINRAREFLSGGMDISDGLFCDTNKLLDANELGYELLENIPDEVGLSGEEYEMLIAFKPENRDKILEIAKETNTPLTIFAKTNGNDELRFECKNHHFKD
jgi:thiamine-monophosphate kinase